MQCNPEFFPPLAATNVNFHKLKSNVTHSNPEFSCKAFIFMSKIYIVVKKSLVVVVLDKFFGFSIL